MNGLTGGPSAASGACFQLGTPITPSTASVPFIKARPMTYCACPE